LRLRQARVLWVFNPNELETKELVNEASGYRSYAMCGTRVRHTGGYHTIDPSISAKRPRFHERAQRLPRMRLTGTALVAKNQRF
jgi:hypothetical protein